MRFFSKRNSWKQKKKEKKPSWEFVKSSKVSRKTFFFFFHAREHNTSPFNIPRIATSF